MKVPEATADEPISGNSTSSQKWLTSPHAAEWCHKDDTIAVAVTVFWTNKSWSSSYITSLVAIWSRLCALRVIIK